MVEEEYLKYPGIEIRLCLKGRALRLSESIKKEDLRKRGGEREILTVSHKAYMKDKRVNRIMNIEKYYKIQRKAGETVKEYVERYEHVAWKCGKEGGGELPEEMRGWHTVSQARLDMTTKTIIIGACSAEALYEEIKEELLRITADREVKTEAAWAEKEKRKESQTKGGDLLQMWGKRSHI